MNPHPQIDAARLTAWYDAQAPFYHLWRDHYDAPGVRSALGALCAALPALPSGGEVLDLGCGTGLYSIALARSLPACRIVGLDLSRGMLHVAERQAARHALANIAFVHGDAQSLPFAEGSFAAVVAGGLMSSLCDRGRVIAEMARVVAPGGAIVLSEFDGASAGPVLRAFVALMTAGQRCIATLRPRYRFARRWRAASSFVEAEELVRRLAEAGGDARLADRGGGHYTIIAMNRLAAFSGGPLCHNHS
jgi:demethylmenaquinone methyltransferase/2-methoxy-6-polyprenyl-1,4-benzoquinol methylase